MEKNVNVLILRTAGTNCDQETAFAFKSCGAHVERVHIKSLSTTKDLLDQYHILAIPGGFSYGDDIASGKILANELRLQLTDQLQRFVSEGKLIIGICNGFQILVKAGILPGSLTDQEKSHPFSQTTTLTHNDSGRFEDRWVHLKVQNKSVWTDGITKILSVPVAHGEGKFIPKDQHVLDQLKKNGQIALRYCHGDGGQAQGYPDNPNGSIDDIAGITDISGRVLGLMPHPERHFLFTHHPHWTRLKKTGPLGDGAKIFENGIRYVRKHLLGGLDESKGYNQDDREGRLVSYNNKGKP